MALMQTVSVSFVQQHPSPERLQTAARGAVGALGAEDDVLQAGYPIPSPPYRSCFTFLKSLFIKLMNQSS